MLILRFLSARFRYGKLHALSDLAKAAGTSSAVARWGRGEFLVKGTMDDDNNEDEDYDEDVVDTSGILNYISRT